MWADSLADPNGIRMAVDTYLALGDPEQARRLIARHGDRLEDPARLELAASVAAAQGEWTPAAQAFGAAASMRAGPDRGILEARAGQAFEAAGARDAAAAAYARARSRLPVIAGWLAVKEALLVSSASLAESLLVSGPAEAQPLVMRARARLRLLEGEAQAAESLLVEARLTGQAADLALARGDTAAAVAHAVAATRVADTAEVRRAVVLFEESLPLPTPVVALAAARGAARLGSIRQAAAWGVAAVALGDSSPATLIATGGWLEAGGRRREALTPYGRAGVAGEFRHARARLRLGDRTAIGALRRLALARPEDPEAPSALLLAADALRSDSLLRELARRWPQSPEASSARMRVALRHLAAGDSAAAVPLLDAEVAVRGRALDRARFLRARVAEGGGDSAAALAAYATLAQEDSLGYYGLLARRAAGLPDPVLAPVPARQPDPEVTTLLAQLALLDSLGFAREAELLVASLMDREWGDVETLLDVADGLAALGRANRSIRLGFVASRERSLNDARVLRAVFPWPERDLVEAEARAFGLDPFLVAGLIRQESWFLASARSRAGAVGYMQLMPATAGEVARRLGVPWTGAMLTMPDGNLHLGCAHLAALLRTYGGDPVLALAAYNAGGTPVRRWRSRAGASEPAAFVEQVTYPETQGYLRAVVRNAALYRWMYGPPSTEHGP